MSNDPLDASTIAVFMEKVEIDPVNRPRLQHKDAIGKLLHTHFGIKPTSELNEFLSCVLSINVCTCFEDQGYETDGWDKWHMVCEQTVGKDGNSDENGSCRFILRYQASESKQHVGHEGPSRKDAVEAKQAFIEDLEQSANKLARFVSGEMSASSEAGIGI